MAYRNPAFILRNYAAEIGVANFSGSAYATGFGYDRLIDYRHSKNFKFSGTLSGMWVAFDITSLGGVTVNRVVIPAGHNLAGQTVRVRSAATAPPVSTVTSVVPTAGLIDISFADSTHLIWVVDVVESGTQWEFPEIWLSRYQQTITGPRPAWQLPLYTPAVIRSFATREAVLAASTSRRRLVMEHQGISGADLTLYADLLGRGVRTPFWFYPPDDDALFPSPLLMRLTDDGELEQDHPVPTVGRSYTAKIRALEQTT